MTENTSSRNTDIPDKDEARNADTLPPTTRNILDKAITHLKTDYESGARQLALFALSALAECMTSVSSDRSCSTVEKEREMSWDIGVFCAKELVGARPSMSAGIESCLVRALEGIERAWGDENLGGDLGGVVRDVVGLMVEKREKDGKVLGRIFGEYVLGVLGEMGTLSKQQVDILTLSNSSTIRSVLLSLFNSTTLSIHLSILESRPRCEGADLLSSILSNLSPAQKSRLSTTIYPDCAVSTPAKTSHILLLGADKISPNGSVSNKIGSLAAAIAIKTLGRKNAKVVVISDVDKIVPEKTSVGGIEEEVEIHPPSELSGAWNEKTREGLDGVERVEVFGEWFEWVGAEWVDGYVTEMGVWGGNDVAKWAGKVGEMKARIFGE